MASGNVTGLKHLTEDPSYDTSYFVNEGPFFDKHPDVIKNILRFEATDETGHIVESWERNSKGIMVETTKRDMLREELIAAQEAYDRLKEKEDKDNG